MYDIVLFRVEVDRYVCLFFPNTKRVGYNFDSIILFLQNTVTYAL